MLALKQKIERHRRRQDERDEHVHERRATRTNMKLWSVRENLHLDRFHSGRTPLGGPEGGTEFVEEPRSGTHQIQQLGKWLPGTLEGIEGSNGFYRTIHGPVAFRLERAKEAIPNDEDRAMIFVDVPAIAAVMHAMVRRRIEDPFEWSEGPDDFGVEEKLIYGVESNDRGKHRRGKTQNRERQVKKTRNQRLKRTLAQSDGEVHVFALVVRRMSGPGQVHSMRNAVKPVIQEILGEKENDPRPDVAHANLEYAVLVETNVVAGDEPDGQGAENGLGQTQHEVHGDIGATKNALAATPTDERLDANEEEINRYR